MSKDRFIARVGKAEKIFSVLGFTTAVLGGVVLVRHFFGSSAEKDSAEEQDDDFLDEDYLLQRDGQA